MVLYPNKLPESERVCSGICNREEDNTHFYANKKRMEERNMSDLCEAIFGVKLQKKGNWLHNLFRHLHKLYRR